jgi:hypothetical protein
MIDTIINQVTEHKHLGLEISNDGSWQKHIDLITKKAFKCALSITTRCFLSVRYFFIHNNKDPCVPIFSNLLSKSLCQTLSKALLISQKTTRISFPSSKAFPNSFVRLRSWLIGVNPYWCGVIILFSSKKL